LLAQGPAGELTLLLYSQSLTKHARRALSTMGDREDLVYQAKLAEQAERYDGKRL